MQVKKNNSENSDIRERLDASIQGVNRLCTLALHMVIILVMKIHIEDIFFQDLK